MTVAVEVAGLVVQANRVTRAVNAFRSACLTAPARCAETTVVAAHAALAVSMRRVTLAGSVNRPAHQIAQEKTVEATDAQEFVESAERVKHAISALDNANQTARPIALA